MGILRVAKTLDDCFRVPTSLDKRIANSDHAYANRCHVSRGISTDYTLERCAQRASLSTSPSSLGHISMCFVRNSPLAKLLRHLPGEDAKANEPAHHSKTQPLFCSINSVHASFKAIFGLNSPMVSVSLVNGSVGLRFRCSMSVARS